MSHGVCVWIDVERTVLVVDTLRVQMCTVVEHEWHSHSRLATGADTLNAFWRVLLPDSTQSAIVLNNTAQSYPVVQPVLR